MCGSPRIPCWLLVVTLSGLGGCGTTEREGNAGRTAESASRTTGPSDARLEFDQVYGPWRTVVGQLAELDLQYHTAAPRRREELRARYDALVAQGMAAQDQVFQAAVTAYARAPAANPDLAEFLTGSVFMLVTQEEYEDGLRVAQILLDGGVASADLRALAGTAAFATGEFALAETHLRRAQKETGVLGVADQYLADIAHCQAAWDKEQAVRAAERAADDLPRVLLVTTQGEIELELFENEAPQTVANFVWLVEQGFYNGLTFHRVVARLMAETGCPIGDGQGGPGYSLPGESHVENRRAHFRGSVAMVHSARNTMGSRFYLAFVPIRQLDGTHTVFGRVVRGMEVLAKLQRREPLDTFTRKVNPHSNVVETPADKIITARVLRQRNHPYQPRTSRLPTVAGQQRATGS